MYLRDFFFAGGYARKVHLFIAHDNDRKYEKISNSNDMKKDFNITKKKQKKKKKKKEKKKKKKKKDDEETCCFCAFF